MPEHASPTPSRTTRENCLQCHAEAKGFREDSNHEPLEDIFSGKDRCVECHEDIHGVEQEEAGETDAAKSDDDAQPAEDAE